jgi:hypothetical protein
MDTNISMKGTRLHSGKHNGIAEVIGVYSKNFVAVLKMQLNTQMRADDVISQFSNEAAVD